MQTSLIDRRVSWSSSGDQLEYGTVRALAYDESAQEWYALVEPDNGGPFRDLAAATLTGG